MRVVEKEAELSRVTRRVREICGSELSSVEVGVESASVLQLPFVVKARNLSRLPEYGGVQSWSKGVCSEERWWSCQGVCSERIRISGEVEQGRAGRGRAVLWRAALSLFP